MEGVARRIGLVGLIGLGRIGRVHLDALAQVPGIEVVATFDTRGIGTCGSVEELLAARAETVIVATPAATHAAVCHDVLHAARQPLTLLVEKPMATTVADVDGLQRDAAAAACHLHVLYHCAYAPEVAWGAGVARSVGDDEGGIASIETSFSDHVPSDTIADHRRVYLSSWLDLAVNALSVLEQFVRVESLDVEHTDTQRSEYRATAVCTATSGRPVTAHVHTAWRDDRKQTEIRFRSGATLALDHQRMTGRVTGTSTSVTSFRATTEQPRLVSHYTALFSELLSRSAPRFTPADDLRLHRLLLEAAGVRSAPR
jgi:predicted dehydrogenase